ncbi:hypothetical protein L9W92_11775, partial [Pelotomaculum terephthalicicum JT]|uniref:hypothetical protein n=1 Tax=Pelotomaculum terephthalicicum TaxID=206393 RepID=UPI001F04AACE
MHHDEFIDITDFLRSAGKWDCGKQARFRQAKARGSARGTLCREAEIVRVGHILCQKYMTHSALVPILNIYTRLIFFEEPGRADNLRLL